MKVNRAKENDVNGFVVAQVKKTTGKKYGTDKF